MSITNLLRTINNNEVYEKIRPLKRMTNVLKEDQAHGDDTYIQISKDQEKSLELFSYENQHKSEKQIDIPPMSSSSNEFSFEMAMPITDTSNEALKTDDENGMTKPYFIPNSYQKDIILSDVSLQQQLPIDECEYEIDLGNGWITKSLSPYLSDNKQRTTSILSADSIQPTTTFTTKYPIEENPINHYNESNILFNSQDNLRQQWSKVSLRTVTTFSIGTAVIIFLVVLMFFIF